MKTLVIAEKPSVGRDIARVLGCGRKGEGYLYGDDYVVSWAIGHLATLLDPEDYDPNLKLWRMETLPIIPTEMRCKAISQTKKQLTVLKKLMNAKDISSLVCATDSGREGELIFRYIYDLVKCRKPFKRLWISSLTDTAIRAGFSSMKDGHEYDALYRSAKCRAEADWLVGMNASRAYTLQYGTLLSVGRVQTPTLALLSERQKEIEAFVPMNYWEVKARFATDQGLYDGLWFDAGKKEGFDTKILDKEKAHAIAQKVKGQAGTAVSVVSEDKRQPPPLLYDLTELQRECNRKLNFSAKKTLSIAQSLYEKKLITYPRTDSRYLSGDMTPKLKKNVESLKEGNLKEAAAYVLGLPNLPVSKRIADDSRVTDHHAIIPTETKAGSRVLSADEQAVYDWVARRFLSVFYPDYTYQVTTVITEVAGERFLSKGRIDKQVGWMALYNQEKREGTEDEKPLPPLTQGAAVTVSNTQVLSKKTQPPKAYTEATLLSAMENAGRLVEDEALKEELKELGLGTPATRAAIIERLLTVGYVVRKQKNLIVTEKGMKLIAIMPPELRSPETTGKWEKSLSRIAKGHMDENRFMESIKRYVCYLVESAAAGDAESKAGIFPKESPTGRRGKTAKSNKKAICACPKCKEGEVFENSKAFYCSRWRAGCAFTLWKSELERKGQPVTDETVRALCARDAT